jgi:hypothetical protein
MTAQPHDHHTECSDRYCDQCMVRWAVTYEGVNCWCCGRPGRVDFAGVYGNMICFEEQERNARSEGVDVRLLHPPNLYATLEP